MVRGLLNKLVSRSLSVAGKWQHHQLRRLNIHEYQVNPPSLSLTPFSIISNQTQILPSFHLLIFNNLRFLLWCMINLKTIIIIIIIMIILVLVNRCCAWWIWGFWMDRGLTDEMTGKIVILFYFLSMKIGGGVDEQIRSQCSERRSCFISWRSQKGHQGRVPQWKRGNFMVMILMLSQKLGS